MTWILGAVAFNGYVCVSDVQATIVFKDKSKANQYFDCVKKVHKVTENLCVAFSGDIRTGLLMIDELRSWLDKCIGPGEYFSTEGQLPAIQVFLRTTYERINPIENPNIELMFLWSAQEETSVYFRPWCMRFIGPDFRVNSSAIHQVDQSGSGRKSKEFNVLTEFLSGREAGDDIFHSRFEALGGIPRIWTAKKVRTLVTKEASSIKFAGVSQSFVSMTAELPYKDIIPHEFHEVSNQVFELLGVEFSEVKTRGDQLNMMAIDPVRVRQRVDELQKNNPDLLLELSAILAWTDSKMDLSPLAGMPSIEEIFHKSPEEKLELTDLCCTWDEVRNYFKSHLITMKACTALG